MSREDIIDKLETWVLDEGKTVTYKVLSREFKIHVNAAKQYLFDFVTTQKTKENISLKATYVLAGIQEEDGNKFLKVSVVSQNSLEKAKKELVEVTSCHTYSVSTTTQDETNVFNADQLYNQKSQEYGDLLVIKHPKIEIKKLTLSKVNPVKNEPKPFFKTQPAPALKNGKSLESKSNGKNEKFFKNNTTKVDEVENQKSEKSPNKEVKKSAAESKPQKTNALASLWQKNEEKSKVVKSDGSKTEGKGKTKSPQEAKKVPPKNNIMSMFSKQSEKNAGNASKKIQMKDTVPVKKVEVFPTPKEVQSATTTKSEKTLDSSSKLNNKKRKSSQKKTKNSGKQNKDSDSDDCKPAKKKHRRIAVFDDSDSDSECEDMEAQDKAQRSLWLPEEPVEVESPVVPPTPETDDGEDPIPPTPPVILQKGRKKICKTVKKTFMDDEGFMVTTEEKEIVSESGSDEDPIPSERTTTKNVAKANQFTYRKQASLTNFFKRS